MLMLAATTGTPDKNAIVTAASARGSLSRIVPCLQSKVTVPHTLADYVVTEWGVARLKGKTIRERAQQMISIAHPDFHAGLTKWARELYWP